MKNSELRYPSIDNFRICWVCCTALCTCNPRPFGGIYSLFKFIRNFRLWTGVSLRAHSLGFYEVTDTIERVGLIKNIWMQLWEYLEHWCCSWILWSSQNWRCWSCHGLIRQERIFRTIPWQWTLMFHPYQIVLEELNVIIIRSGISAITK